MNTKSNYSLIMLRANIRKRKDKRTFVLTESNVYPELSLEKGLYIMHRCGLPLWAGEGLNQATFIENKTGIGCYEKDSEKIVLAVLSKKTTGACYDDTDISIYPESPESFHLSGLSGEKLNQTFERCIKHIDAGKRLGEDFAEKAIQKARLSLVPKGWKVVTEGNVESGDRYLEEDRTRGYITIIPAIVSWMSCDVSFSTHKPGTPVNDWRGSIIIRKQ